MRKTLEKLVRTLETKNHVSGIGLFGSWSREEATPASDVDLLILDNSNPCAEYVERISQSGVMVDLDHIPKQWVKTVIPPHADQKLYELQILYDRDWTLTNTKLLMTKSYASTERVGIRTEAHIVNSDIYLSRATSAFSREDYRSAYLYSTVALEYIFNVLIEIILQPASNSHFMERLETSAAKLGMPELFAEYLDLAKLGNVTVSGANEKLKHFRTIWDEIGATVKRHPQRLESADFHTRTRLNYYLNPAFLQGITMRANFMIDNGKLAESFHYLDNAFLNIIEGHMWLRSLTERAKIDNTLLIRSLEILEKKNPKNYNQIIDFLDLRDVEKLDATRAIRRTKEIASRIRRNRKILIKNRLTKG